MGLTRRRLLQIGAAAAGVGLLDAVVLEPRWLEVTHHPLPVDRLPAALEGFRIAHITDAHLGSASVSAGALAEAVSEAGAGLVVVTGDVIGAASQLPRVGELCAELARTHAQVVATLGNWEHWGRISGAELGRAYARERARLLINESIEVAGVALSATDDAVAGKPSWRRTLAELPRTGPRLLLTHSPALLDAPPAEPPRFDLALAGHTHGGQLTLGAWAPGVPPGSGRFVAGRYSTPLGAAYVSRGTGTSVVPARFVCRPEMPIFELTRA